MANTSVVRWLSRAGLMLALLGGAGTWWTWYVIDQGQQQLSASRALAAAGKIRPAVVRARRAASWYAPGAPHVRAAYLRLISLARLAESRGDRETALFAWRSLRSAAMTSRSWSIPYEPEVRAANVAIARLSSKTPAPLGAPMQDPQRIQQSLLLSYGQPGPTNRPWVAVMLISAAVSSLGLLMGAWKGLEGDRVRHRPLLVSCGVFVVGFAAWLLACWMA